MTVVNEPHWMKAWGESLWKKRVSFRVYGDKKQYRRPIVHRFEIRGGATMIDAFAENIVRHNALFDHLVCRGKQQ